MNMEEYFDMLQKMAESHKDLPPKRKPLFDGRKGKDRGTPK